jgi:hypothetical protein
MQREKKKLKNNNNKITFYKDTFSLVYIFFFSYYYDFFVNLIVLNVLMFGHMTSLFSFRFKKIRFIPHK